MAWIPLLLAMLLATDPAADDRAARVNEMSHADWSQVLSRYVDDQGLVDYEALAKDDAALDRYVELLGRVSPETHPELFPSRDHELAYYINAYNALVFSGVLESGTDKSVWGGLVPGLKFFVSRKYTVGGEKWNLRNLENKVIREEYQDPRIHAALNCASRGCPILPQVAFEAGQLDGQLDVAMRRFVAEERNVQVDDGQQTVRISKIFDWFKEDFVDYEKQQGNDDADVIDYINRYRESDAQIPDGYKVTILEYDKSLNRQP